MKEIPISGKLVTLVDDQDYDWLNQWKWYAGGSPARIYVARQEKGSLKTIRMHRLILGATGRHVLVDHKNGNTLDNRRENLRLCTTGENIQNQKAHANSFTGVKGVCLFRKKFRAEIQFDKNRVYLGAFEDIKDALLAYNEAALKYHGEFAKLNPI